MTSRAITFFAIFCFSLLAIGCGGAASTNSPANSATNANANANTPAKDAMTNAAPTLTPVFKAYCDAMVKKDEAALRKVYSADTIKYFEDEMKAEKIKSLLKYLEDDAVSGNICEVRNEVITGEKAVAEIRADSYPNGIKIEFVKEGGEWKMTNKSPTIDAVKPTENAPATSSNAANKAAADPAAKK